MHPSNADIRFLQSFSAIIRYRANDNHHSTFLLTIFDRSTDDEKYKKTHVSSVLTHLTTHLTT